MHVTGMTRNTLKACYFALYLDFILSLLLMLILYSRLCQYSQQNAHWQVLSLHGKKKTPSNVTSTTSDPKWTPFYVQNLWEEIFTLHQISRFSLMFSFILKYQWFSCSLFTWAWLYFVQFMVSFDNSWTINYLHT